MQKLTTDLAEVVAALHFSQIVELSVDGILIRRKTPLPIPGSSGAQKAGGNGGGHVAAANSAL